MPEVTQDNVKIWNLARVIQQLGTEVKAMEFAEKKGLIPMINMCEVHKTRMSVEYTLDNPVGSFICKPCGEKSRVNRLSFMYLDQIGSDKLRITLFFYLVYAYASEWNYEMTAKEEFSQEESLCINTIEDCFSLFRRHIVMLHNSNLANYYVQGIGGPGKVVWIGESKLAKKKGQPAANITVIAMLEEGNNDVRLEVCPEDIQSSDSVLPLIQRHVTKGSIVKTSMWQAYDGLHKQYVHKRLENISSDNNNPHSECVETKQQCNDLKRALHKHNVDQTNRAEISDFIVEYSWRRAISRNNLDPFEEFVNVMSLVHEHT